MRPWVVRTAIWLLVTACLAPPLMAQEPTPLKRMSNAATRAALMSKANVEWLSSNEGQPAAGLPRGGPLFMASAYRGPVRIAVGSDWLFVWQQDGEKFEKAPLIQAGRGMNPSIFGPCKTKSSSGADLWLEFVVFPPEKTSRRVLIMPAGVVGATVTVEGRKVFIGIADTNFNGVYGDQLKLPLASFANELSCDALFVDINNDGKFQDDVEQPGVPLEVTPLGDMVRLGDTYLKMTIAADGSSLSLEKVDLKMGRLVASDPSAALVVASSAGVQSMLAGGPQGWTLPEGSYQALMVMLGKRDRQGTWTLSGRVNSSKSTLRVTADESATLSLGEPVIVKANARMGGDRTLSMNYSITDALGTYYLNAALNGSRLPPPRFVILHENGKQLRAGAFSYG